MEANLAVERAVDPKLGASEALGVIPLLASGPVERDGGVIPFTGERPSDTPKVNSPRVVPKRM
ncbi:hypothetical protein [Methylobacterium durans]|uniref:hypothetical protein n=1 Tax=Methylobacterium durans TaxID=2202825 RepID=UPI0013A56157|nr:hypothetical protein [Methylobacterium durans]